MARALVIGGNGFLGSYIVDELAARGHSVTVFDRFSGDAARFESAGITRVVGDFLNQADVARAVKGQEWVFHFLSTTTPASADDDPTVDVRTNIASSIDLLTQCVRAGVSRVFYASTGGAIYGQRSGPATEDSLPAPISPYAIGKLAIEGYLRYFQRKNGLESIVFRISNPYGPRQGADKPQGVIPIFLRRMNANLPVTVFGDGTMLRDYLYVSDAARMVVDVVEGDARHALYNIGSGTPSSVAKVLEVAQEVTGLTPEVNVQPAPSTFVADSVLSVERFTSEFGAPSLVRLDAGIAQTWQAIRAQGH